MPMDRRKLTDRQEQALCKMYEDVSYPIALLAERFGLSREHIRHIAVEKNGCKPRLPTRGPTRYA